MLEMELLYEQARQMRSVLVENRRALHQMPELGMDLPRTTAFVEEKLRALGLEPRRVGGGVTACGKAAYGNLVWKDVPLFAAAAQLHHGAGGFQKNLHVFRFLFQGIIQDEHLIALFEKGKG